MLNKYEVSISTGSKIMTQTLKLTFDLAEWPWHYNGTTQKMQLHEIHLSTKYQMSTPLDQKLWPKLYNWPLTLKNDFDFMMLLLKMCNLVRCTCTPNIKCLSLLDQMLWPKWKWTFFTYIFDLWPWRNDLTLTNYLSKFAAWADACACQISSLYLNG